jgi:hypothetical protein
MVITNTKEENRKKLTEIIAKRISATREAPTEVPKKNIVKQEVSLDTQLSVEELQEALNEFIEEHNIMESCSRASSEGFAACCAGKILDSNPYSQNPELFEESVIENLEELEDAWNQGFFEAMDQIMLYKVVIAANDLKFAQTSEEIDEACTNLFNELKELPVEEIREVLDGMLNESR